MTLHPNNGNIHAATYVDADGGAETLEHQTMALGINR